MTRGPGATPAADVVTRAVRSLDEALSIAPALCVLDVREREVFEHGHLAGAGCIVRAEFASRRMELPPRETPVLVVHDDPDEARIAAAALAARGYRVVCWLDRPVGSEPHGLASQEPPARLWSPSPFLERVIGRCPRGRALDLACGSGRSAVYLALHGWQVEAWDVDPGALRMAGSLADRHGVRLSLLERDLQSGPLAPPETPFDLIVVVRYLHRELFPWIERALAPGGALVYETFRAGQERFGHPIRANHLLQPGELVRAFPSLVVGEYEETPAHEPPVLARLLAHRPEGS